MKCKHCQQELEKGVPLCPECGTDNAPTEERESAILEEMTEETAPAEEMTEETAIAEEAAEQTPEKTEAPKPEVGKIAIAFALLVALLVVLVALVLGGGTREDETQESTGETQGTTTTPDATTQPTEATIPADSGLDDATCKGSYTVSDEALLTQLDTVVATLGDEKMTVADLQVYYWMQARSFLSEYYYYIAYGYVSFDYTQPLDTQVCGFDETRTWQQYFIDCAISAWQEFTGMALAAKENNVPIMEDLQKDLDNMEQTLLEMAQSNGYETVEELLKFTMGPGATYEAYARYMENYYLGYSYYNQLYENAQPTDEEVAAYYQENAEAFEINYGITAEDRLVDVRHILIVPEGGTTDENGQTTYSDEEYQAAYSEAEKILNEWLAGVATEDSFAELANTYSGDPGSNTAGGLYTGVAEGEMTEAFNDWCFDETRVAGDYGMVQTPFGWHIMYFVKSVNVWFTQAQADLINERVTALMDEAVSGYILDVDYSAMALGYLDLVA